MKIILAKLLPFFLALFLSANFAILTQPAYSQMQQVLSGDNTAESDTNDGSDNNSESSGEEKSKEINLSDSIPIDSLIDKVDKTFSSVLEKYGLDDSIASRLIFSAVVVVIFLAVLFIFRRITKAIRKKLYMVAKKYHLKEKHIDFYHKAINWLLFVVLATITTIILLITWGLEITVLGGDGIFASIVANLLTIFFIIVAGKLVIDIACGLVEKAFHKWGNASQARVDTLLPIARNTVYIVFITIFTLMLLSEIGINVMPLLAGAGVLGFAIGFGAQTIIKDLLTGFIIILEDLIQVGDVVTLAERTGVIEKITIRKVQLRNLDGTVYTVPFSEIDIVSNMTKEFSYYMFEVGVAYRENIDEVNKLLSQIDEQMRAEEDFKDVILNPLEIFGLDKFGDSAIVIKARIKTKPASQWPVGREFNRRMKMVFDEQNIEIPFPHQTIYFGEDKKGNAPPLLHKQVSNTSSDEKNDTDPSDETNNVSRKKQPGDTDEASDTSAPEE